MLGNGSDLADEADGHKTDRDIEMGHSIVPLMTLAVPDGGVGGASRNCTRAPKKVRMDKILSKPK